MSHLNPRNRSDACVLGEMNRLLYGDGLRSPLGLEKFCDDRGIEIEIDDDEPAGHQGRADFWLGYLIGWISCVVLGGVLTVVAWIGSN